MTSLGNCKKSDLGKSSAVKQASEAGNSSVVGYDGSKVDIPLAQLTSYQATCEAELEKERKNWSKQKWDADYMAKSLHRQPCGFLDWTGLVEKIKTDGYDTLCNTRGFRANGMQTQQGLQLACELSLLQQDQKLYM